MSSNFFHSIGQKVIILLLFVGFCLFLSCNSTKDILAVSKAATIIPDSSLFQNHKNYSDSVNLEFFYSDLSGLISNSIVLNEDENVKLFIKEPTNIENTPYFINPGETVIVKLAEDGSFVVESNRDKERNRELSFEKEFDSRIIRKLFMSIPLRRDSELAIRSILLSEEQLNNAIRANNIRSLCVLDSLDRTYNIGKEKKKRALQTIETQSLYPLSFFYKEFADTLLKYDLYQSKTKQLIKRFESAIQNENALPTDISSEAYALYAMLIAPDHFAPKEKNTEDFTRYFDTVITNFTGTSKDFLLTKIMFDGYTQGIRLPKNYVRKYRRECSSKRYKEIVSYHYKESRKNQSISIKSRNDLLAINTKKITSVEEVIAENKGKLMLLDFWSSGCAPCLSEMPYSLKLAKKYQYKNVVFVYISLDKIPLRWKTASLTRSLPDTHSYMFADADKSNFIKTYSMETIPRYMLVDSTGVIIDSDAPRPSDPKLKEKIDELLTQKIVGSK